MKGKGRPEPAAARPRIPGTAKVWLVILVLAAAGVFALIGGEYTTFDLLRRKQELADEREAIAQLKVTNDSLEKVATALERDPKAQERVARDQFGMIGEGEHLYRIVPAGGDTAQ